MQNTPENPPEKAPANTPKDPATSEPPSVSPDSVYLSYRAECPTCKTVTWWRETAHSSWCRECCFSVVKTPPEKAPENPPETPTMPTYPSGVPDGGWVSYNTYCPTCETQTRWRATVEGASCNECGLFLEKTPSEDALVSIHAGDTIPTLSPTKCRDSDDHRETQTTKPYFVGGCDWGGS